MNKEKGKVSPDMTVLDIVSDNNETIDIFKKYDEVAGECICCASLFEPLDKVAEKYGIDLESLLSDLNRV